MINRFLFWILLLAISIVAGTSWYRYVYTENYSVYLQLPCNPNTDSCFIFKEDDCVSGECEFFYKIGLVPAILLDKCAPDNGQCALQQCESYSDCTLVTCSQDSLEKFELEDTCSL